MRYAADMIGVVGGVVDRLECALACESAGDEGMVMELIEC